MGKLIHAEFQGAQYSIKVSGQGKPSDFLSLRTFFDTVIKQYGWLELARIEPDKKTRLLGPPQKVYARIWREVNHNGDDREVVKARPGEPEED